jgi:hypothetical protein
MKAFLLSITMALLILPCIAGDAYCGGFGQSIRRQQLQRQRQKQFTFQQQQIKFQQQQRFPIYSQTITLPQQHYPLPIQVIPQVGQPVIHGYQSQMFFQSY